MPKPRKDGSADQSQAAVETSMRTGPDAPEDGRFYRTFVVQARGLDDSSMDDVHRANIVAMHQDAINQGMHPVEQGRHEASKDDGRGSVALIYSVKVLPAGRTGTSTGGPSAVIADMGGSTIAAHQQKD